MISDTIAAIATPAGDGGLGVIRVSGPQAVALAGARFRALDGIALAAQPPRLLQLGRWLGGDGAVMDEALCVRFEAPHSFTGEDVVELHAHGGAFHLQALLKTLLAGGARLARPGEFTQRAFLNGKMDLTRAEAVADLINSGTGLARDAAARQLAGGLFEAVESMRAGLVELSAQTEAAVDFPDEEDQLLPKRALLGKVSTLRERMRAMLASAREGRLLSQGIKAALAGRPNVGKSSLMNALLGSERSIVAASAGTTRDYIEEKLNLGGFPLLLTDTAGLRESDDGAEQEGVRRSLERVAGADLLLLVLDVSRGLEPADFSALASFQGDLIFVANKADLGPRWGEAELKAFAGNIPILLANVSSKTGEGLEALKRLMLEVALRGRSAAMLNAVTLTQARHEEAMRRAEALVGHVEATLREGKLSAEFLSGDLRGALDALGEIVGATPRDEVIHAIFAKFCIGK
jgi:tRNA modification GTPase